MSFTKESILKNTSGYVEFRSYFGLSTHKRTLRPIHNGAGWYKGVPIITDEIRKSGKVYVNPQDNSNILSQVTLKHGDRYDLSSETDRMILEWLLEHTHAINLGQSDGVKRSTQTFYIYNKEVDINSRAKQIEIKDTAIMELRNLTQDNLYVVARLLGFRFSNLEPEEVRMTLRDLFDDKIKGVENAKKFLNAINDKQKEIKSFIHKAIDQSIIKHSDRGEYKFKDYFIGTSFESVVAWVKNVENKDLVMQIREELGTPITDEDVANTTTSKRGRKPSN